MSFFPDSPKAFKGTGYKQLQLSNLSPDQQRLFQFLTGQLTKQKGNLSQGLGLAGGLASGRPEAFAEAEAPAFSAFNKLAGNISSRFSGVGSGARQSSGFQNSLAGAAGDLAQNLGSQRLSLQRQALMDLLGLHGELMGQRTFENQLIEKPRSFWQSLGLAGAEGAGRALGSLPFL